MAVFAFPPVHPRPRRAPVLTPSPAAVEDVIRSLAGPIVSVVGPIVVWLLMRALGKLEATAESMTRIETQLTGGTADGMGGMRGEMVDLKAGVRDASRKVDEVNAVLREQNQATHTRLAEWHQWRDDTNACLREHDERLGDLEGKPPARRRQTRRRAEDR